MNVVKGILLEEKANREQFELLQETFSVEEERVDENVLMENPFNPKDIDIKTKTMSLDLIIKRLREDEIDLSPDFQRSKDLWDIEKQSRLVESILIKFPLPAFYFDGSNDDKWLVVDGLQRLSSIRNFVVEESIKLTGLEFLNKLEGKTFRELPRPFQRQIEEAEIQAYIINPGTPEDVKFNIFKRINTGGLVLTAQEIRHALNQGIPAQFVTELAQVEAFKQATDDVIDTTRMLDREFVTRFLSFYIYEPDDYKPDLDTFMTMSMASLKKTSPEERARIKYNFTEAMTLAWEIFSKWAFRKVYDMGNRRLPLNKALFEVWSAELARLDDEERGAVRTKKELVFEKFVHLMNTDKTFNTAITSGTGDRNRLMYRFNAIKKLLKEIIS